MNQYNVVAAVITHNGKYLCMQKGKTRYDYTSNKYEFPGGKVESGETEPQALARELLEEMDYQIRIERHLVTVHHEYPDFGITLSAYLCSVSTDRFRMNEHVGYKWLDAADLRSLDWAAADVGIVDALLKSTGDT